MERVCLQILKVVYTKYKCDHIQYFMVMGLNHEGFISFIEKSMGIVVVSTVSIGMIFINFDRCANYPTIDSQATEIYFNGDLDVYYIYLTNGLYRSAYIPSNVKALMRQMYPSIPSLCSYLDNMSYKFIRNQQSSFGETRGISSHDFEYKNMTGICEGDTLLVSRINNIEHRLQLVGEVAKVVVNSSVLLFYLNLKAVRFSRTDESKDYHPWQVVSDRVCIDNTMEMIINDMSRLRAYSRNLRLLNIQVAQLLICMRLCLNHLMVTSCKTVINDDVDGFMDAVGFFLVEDEKPALYTVYRGEIETVNPFTLANPIACLL